MVRVAILGAGASGLAAIKCCLDEGLDPVCFEMTDTFGGLWRYREDNKYPELGCVFKSTVINTSKEMMAFSDFPCPKEFANFMHNRKVSNYYELYVEKFDLLKHIHFNNSITSVAKTPDFATSGRWDVEVKDELTGSVKTETFDAVLVCNGHHAEPYYPEFPGLDEFEGRKVHSHYYRTPDEYRDKRVVVIGIGNSGGDAAVELSRWASQVYLSTRRGSWIFQRGIPGDLQTTRASTLIPRWLGNRLIAKQLNATFDHKLYGLQPKHMPLDCHPMANSDLPDRVVNGTVIVKPDIARFTKTGVEFEDGTTEDNIDAVIVATGYTFGYPFLSESVIKVEDNKVSLYKFVFPPDLERPTLAVIGLVQPWGAINPISELQSRWAVRVFSGKAKLPSDTDMHWDIAARRLEMEGRYLASRRHTIEVEYIDYMDQVAKEFGVKPSLPWLLFTDPRLFLSCAFGPCVPYQYRIHGPGNWRGAREAIMTVWDRVEAPFQTRDAATEESTFFKKALLLITSVGVGVVVVSRYTNFKTGMPAFIGHLS